MSSLSIDVERDPFKGTDIGCSALSTGIRIERDPFTATGAEHDTFPTGSDLGTELD